MIFTKGPVSGFVACIPLPSLESIIEEQCVDIPDKDAKISFVKNKVLEKMKRTVRRQSMSGSVCSGITSRASSRTRQRSEDGLVDKEPAPKLIKATHVLDRKSRLPAPALHNS